MRKIIRFAQAQTAQGLVEFALVLPVLMLIILGIFAFGHYFFAYSSIVSASREASRWGAAVGASTGPFPRYKDCDAIRAAAVRVGSFAGVTPSTVTITYDSGPDDTTTPKPDCPFPVGSQGPDIALGNRINVSITVQYTPIVPLLQLPSFPITANSSRTILLGLPVGDVPTAQSIYPTTTLNVTVNSVPVVLNNPGSSSIVGQVFPITVNVTASNGTIPTGNIYIGDDSSPQQLCGPIALDPSGNASCPATFVYYAVTTDPLTSVNHPHVIGIRYDPNGALYNPSTVNVNHSVAQATSTTTITSVNPLSPAAPTQTITLKAHVAPQFAGIPTGTVELRLADNTKIGSQTLDASGNATFTYVPTFTGDNTFTVFYQGDTNFTASQSASYPYHVESLDVNIALTPLQGTVNSPIPFTITVTSANGTGGVPQGTIIINDTQGHTCNATLNASGVANCSITFTTAQSYTLTVNFGSGSLTFKNKSATFTLNVINQIATYIQLSPTASTITPTHLMTFNFTVTQADGKAPNGTVSLTSSLQPGTPICTTTLNNTQTGTCTLSNPLPMGGPYSFVANFTPSNTTTYGASLSNTVTVTVASMCPTASAMSVSSSSIQFEVSNTSPNNVALNVSQIDVTWAPSINPLKDIVFADPSSAASGTCSSTGTNNICVWAYKRQNANDPNGGIYPSPQTFSATSALKSGWDSNLANIGAGQVKVFRLDFANQGLQSTGNMVTITFGQYCSPLIIGK